MQIDKRAEFASSKHLTAGTTNDIGDFYNCGGDFDLGPGEPIYWILAVLAKGGSIGTTSTFTFTLQTDDNTSFSSPSDIATIVVPYNVADGAKPFGVSLPFANEQYLRVKAVVADGNGTADITVASWMSNEQPVSYQAYPQNLNN
jgi:hypothetical protein